MKPIFFFLLAGALLAPGCSHAQTAPQAAAPQPAAMTPKERADLDIVRARMTENARRDTLPSNEATLKLIGDLTPQGTWPDLDYADQANGNWSPSQHFSRVLSLALAYGSPTLSDGKPNPAYESAPLREAIGRAFDGWFSVLPPGTPRAISKPGNAFKDALTTPTSRNWWHNEIGTPLKVATIALLAPDALGGERLGRAVQIMERAHMPQDKGGTNSGANLTWRSRITTAQAVLTGDAGLLRQVVAEVEAPAHIVGGEGIQADYGFWQHGAQFYLLGYGQGYSADLTELALLYRDTSFALRPDIVELLTHLTLEGYQWVMRGPFADYNAMGRGIANPRKDDVSDQLKISERLLALGTARREEIEAYRGRLQGEAGAAPLVGDRVFWRSGILSHQRAGYGVSVRVTPSNLTGGELINGQGVQSRYTGDGVTYLRRRGDEYRNLSPVLNFRRLPGTTGANSPQKPTMPGPYVKGASEFAGGVSDGMYGAMAFDYARDGVRARKSWFFFDDEYACLGAGISASPEVKDAVVSTIEQRRATQPLTRSPQGAPGASWIAHEGTGVVFLDPTATIRASVGPQSGNWRDVNSDTKDQPATETVFSLFLDHGAAPQNASYAYIVVPQIAPGALPAYAAKLPVEVLSNTPQLQAVRHAALQLTQAAFYAPGTLKIMPALTISPSRACLILVRQSGQQLVLTVAEPPNPPAPRADAPELEIEVSAALRGEGATRLPGGKTRLKFALPTGLYEGQSVSRTFQLAAP